MKLPIVLCVIAIVGGVYWFTGRNGTATADAYRTVPVERGDLKAVVSTTGTLEPVTTVQVGTQVSGIISEILVDYNDTVVKDQVIARIDPALLDIQVRDGQAGLDRAQADFKKAQREFQRIEKLYARQMASEDEFIAAQCAFDGTKASVESARVALDRAKQGLAYATIHAPISGTVVERNVAVGQTVAASLQAPQLFLIADDLSRMRILASVDESDIGRIKEGQAAEFTVQSYAEETFTGRVRQVRLQSKTEENVVTYTVVVDVSNPEGKLLPGMTATIEFLVATATDVMKVANAALRFRPTEDMLKKLSVRQESEPNERPDRPTSQRQGEMGAARQVAGGLGGGQDRSDLARLWYVDEQGVLAVVAVRTGISDGQSTQIEGSDVRPGLRVIAGISRAASRGSTNPFQQTREQRPPGPPMPGF
ncbi:MAG: efflux RND transporter periplasmic adaptor subunit [Phycisphaerae bacterium]|nr:efflux RND transporter periplasmic adaptor subunit [Phycisphaerae bacterium]